MEGKDFVNITFRIVSFLYGISILLNVLILVRIILMNYGEKTEWHDIKRAIIIFGSISIILYLIKMWLSNKNNTI